MRQILKFIFCQSLLLCLGLGLGSAALASSLRIADDLIPPEDWAGNRSIPPAERFADVVPDDPWILSADRLVSYNDGVILEASGNVRLEHGEDYLEADFARYFLSTDWIYLGGNIRLKYGADILQAEEAELNLASFTGWLTNGKVFLSEPHIYFEGERVTKHWGDNYSFENAMVTTCDGPNPAWSLSAATARLELDGYAVLDQTRFKVYGQRILYAPYLIIPAKVTRQSGFLIPEAGYSSLNGFYFSLPYYKVLSPSRDLTLNLTIMHRAGFLPSLEYRSYTSDANKTWLALDLLYTSKTVDHDTLDKVDNQDGLIRDNRWRGWLRGMGDGQLGRDWNYRYTIDYVSDQNFLREFQNRISGFNENQLTLRDAFGRDLRPIDQARRSQFVLYRNFSQFSLSLDAVYNQDPGLGNGNAPLSSSRLTQIFPRLSVQMQRLRMFAGLPLEFDGRAELAWMYQATGQAGLRLELQPRLVLPLNLGPISFRAEGNLRQTAYLATRDTHGSTGTGLDNDSGRHKAQYRFLPEFKAEALTQLARTWDWTEQATAPALVGDRTWTGLRHLFQPRLTYHYLRDTDQSALPHYLDDDRLAGASMLYLDLVNTVTVRQISLQQAEDGGLREQTGYFELVRFNIGLGYNFLEAGRERNLDAFARQPFTDLKIEAALNLSPWFGIWTKSYLSLYGDGLTLSESGLSLRHPRWGSLSLSYLESNGRHNYQSIVQALNPADLLFDDPARLLRTAFAFSPVPGLSLDVALSYDLDNRKLAESVVQIGYTHQCYRIAGGFKQQGSESSVFINISLLGFN